ncbi:hypothetical protein QFZ66_007791 [Streptomyces sp. B4I13]|uniref:hypothetical protein n=1 Tax=Streptomyces sp. B4I13 TaxID=3042271 RepID=UPI00278644F2|nr:hypothetical protein [Streptomyces sp. B4I13]MDQ0963913.1 hypothetical protein [Streptomyces sp. B4I13]
MMQQADKPEETPDETEVLSGPADAEERNHSGLRTPWRRRSPRARAVIAATTVAVSVVGSRSGDAYTADRVLCGSPGEHRPDDRRGGFPGHGPWGRGGDDRSPGPTDGGAAS